VNRLGDPALGIWTNVGMARAYFAVGDYRRGIERARTALEALDSSAGSARFKNLPPPVGSRTWLALCLAAIGQFAEAVPWAEAAVQLAERAAAPLAQVWADYTLGRILCVRGHLTPALEILERAASLLDHGPFPIYGPRVLASLGTAYALTGRARDGLALVQRAAVDGEANRVLFEHAMVLVQLGEAHLGVRDLEAAGHCARRALEFARQHGERGNEAWAVHLLGRVTAAHPSRDAAEAALPHLTRAMALATALDMRPLVAHCRQALAALCRRAGTSGEAGEHLAAATEMYREMDMSAWLEPGEIPTTVPAVAPAPP
jgi:tetratricopeptide (TPR) repeat protein